LLDSVLVVLLKAKPIYFLFVGELLKPVEPSPESAYLIQVYVGSPFTPSAPLIPSAPSAPSCPTNELRKSVVVPVFPEANHALYALSPSAPS